MEGAGLHSPHAKVAKPGSHLRCRSRCERHRQHSGGLESPLRHAIGNAVGDGAGLTRSGSSKHAQRPRDMLGNGALIVVKVGE